MEVVQASLLELQERVEEASGRGDSERTESPEALAMHLELAGKKRLPLRVASAQGRARRVRAAIRVAIVEEREESVQNGLAGDGEPRRTIARSKT